MVAHIIRNPFRPKENTTLYTEIIEQGITHEYWNAVTDSANPVRSINLSHKQIILHAKLLKLPKICIMEEDVWFPAPDGWQYFLDNEPGDYDLYLGGVYGLNQSAMNRLEGTGTIQINNFAGLHCYIIHERYYDTFLSIPEDQHIDLGNAGLGKYLVCYPFAAVQHPGWSSNNRDEVDYNVNIKEHIYYGSAVHSDTGGK